VDTGIILRQYAGAAAVLALRVIVGMQETVEHNHREWIANLLLLAKVLKSVGHDILLAG